MSRTGVLITGFGGPDSLEAVGPFMCNLMGREPSDELVERVCRRYLAIGGRSPINEIAGAIAARLAGALAERGHDLPVGVGMRYWRPFIGEALASLIEQGCERVVTLSLSPFEAKVAHGAYREAVDAAAARIGDVDIVEAPLVSELPAFVDFFAGSTAAGIASLEPNDAAVVVFTAHSLPEADLVDDDPYLSGLKRVAGQVAEALGLAPGTERASTAMLPGVEAYGSASAPRAWFLAFQSKGNRSGAWLGPDLHEVIDAAAGSSVTGLVVVPIGFWTDHMETLYDLDIVAADRALSQDLEFVRCPVPNDDENLIGAVAERILALG